MHRRGILVLVVVVGLLYAAARYADQRDAEEGERIETMLERRDLLPGIGSEDLEHLRRVRIDNLERTVQVTMEVDAEGAWTLTDPILWPADVSVVAHLFQTLERDAGVPAPDVDPADVGLDPPRALCELTFERPDEAPETHLLEVGAVDLDQLRMFVAVTGPDGERRVLTANRALETVFQRFDHDFRSKAILALDPAHVVEVRRSGPATLPAPADPTALLGPAREEIPNPLLPPPPFAGLDLVLRQGPRGWQATAPYVGALDPQAAAMLVLTLSRLEATGFSAEAAPDLAAFGFDRPELELELVDADGDVLGLAFARTPAERKLALERSAAPLASEWLCMVEGRPTVFEVSGRAVMLAAGPADAFVDARILRGGTELVRAVTWAAGGREVRLRREAGFDGGWTVSGPSASGASLEDRPADPERVDEFLQGLRGVELAELLPDAELAPSLVPVFLRVDVSGEERGGDLGPVTGAGPDTLGFRRLGEELVASVDPAVLDLLATPPEEFLDRRLLEVEELRLGAVELELGGERLRFERDARRGRWARAGQADEDRAFAGLVDRLRSLKALSFVLVPAGSAPPPLADPVTVTLDLPAESGPRGRPAERISYRLAVGEAGTELFERGTERALVYPGLRAELGRLFAP